MDTDLHRDPVWAGLRDFYREQWCATLKKQQESVLTVKDRGCQKRLQPSSATKVSCRKHWQTGLVEEAIVVSTRPQ